MLLQTHIVPGTVHIMTFWASFKLFLSKHNPSKVSFFVWFLCVLGSLGVNSADCCTPAAHLLIHPQVYIKPHSSLHLFLAHSVTLAVVKLAQISTSPCLSLILFQRSCVVTKLHFRFGCTDHFARWMQQLEGKKNLYRLHHLLFSREDRVAARRRWRGVTNLCKEQHED